jgi:hypothetical protein
MLSRPISLTLIAAVGGVLLAACGSSSTPTTARSSGVTSDTAIKFSQCMRAHGVSNFPDPGSHGTFDFGPQSGINPQSPAFQAAQQACKQFAPVKGPPPTMSESQRQAAFRFAQCMRSHGVPNFPDPTQTAPSGAVRVLVLNGMVFALGPGIDPKSPGFRQAASMCGVRPPPGPPQASSSA